MIPTREPLGRLLRKRRLEKRLTQTLIANYLREQGIQGVSQPVLGRIERGMRELVAFDAPARLSILRTYGFSEEEIQDLDDVFDLGLEAVLTPDGMHARSDQGVKLYTVWGLNRSTQQPVLLTALDSATHHAAPSILHAAMREHDAKGEYANVGIVELDLEAHTYASIRAALLESPAPAHEGVKMKNLA